MTKGSPFGRMNSVTNSDQRNRRSDILSPRSDNLQSKLPNMLGSGSLQGITGSDVVSPINMKDELDSSRPVNIPTGQKQREPNNAGDTTNNTFVLKGALKNARSPLSSEQGSNLNLARDKASIIKR